MAKKLTKEEFISKTTGVEYLNNYDYSDVVYVNNSTPVCIKCPIHGKFFQSPNNHLNGSNCPHCAEVSRRSHIRNNTEKFIKSSRKIHGDKYDYSKSAYGKNNVDKIIIICKKHGEFLQTPNDHLDGCGCPKCGLEINGKLRTKTTETFIKDAKEIWGNTFDYSKSDYKGCHKKIIIICKKHGEFLQIPSNHTNLYQGCPKCKSSKGELKIENFLKEKKIYYVHQKYFDDCRSDVGKRQVLKFDFYIPSKNLLIEYDGKQHFKTGSIVGGRHITTKNDLIGIRRNDKIKTKYAKKNSIELLRIKYTKFNQIVQILESKFNA